MPCGMTVSPTVTPAMKSLTACPLSYWGSHSKMGMRLVIWRGWQARRAVDASMDVIFASSSRLSSSKAVAAVAVAGEGDDDEP